MWGVCTDYPIKHTPLGKVSLMTATFPIGHGKITCLTSWARICLRILRVCLKLSTLLACLWTWNLDATVGWSRSEVMPSVWIFASKHLELTSAAANMASLSDTLSEGMLVSTTLIKTPGSAFCNHFVTLGTPALWLTGSSSDSWVTGDSFLISSSRAEQCYGCCYADFRAWKVNVHTPCNELGHTQ